MDTHVHPQDLRMEMEHTYTCLMFEETMVHHDLSSLAFDSGTLISDARLHVGHGSMSVRCRNRNSHMPRLKLGNSKLYF